MPLTIKGKQEVFKGKFIKVWATDFLDKANNGKVWEWVEKKDAAMVFPITKDNNIVLIKNYRVPLERYVIEMPAGLLDKNGESREDAIHRELMEETGYRAENIFALPLSPYAAGTSNNLSFPFIATGVTKVSDNCGDISEDISVIEVPADQLVDYYLKNTDVLFNVQILAFYQIALTKGYIK